MLLHSFMLDARVSRIARINFVVVFAEKASVEADNALALLQAGNATLMFADIVGSGELPVML